MTKEQLLWFKAEIRRFCTAYDLVANYLDLPQYELINVLLQNASFDGSDTSNYNFDDEVERVHEIDRILLQLSKYYDTYMEKWVFTEYNNLLLAAICLDEIDV